MLFDVRPVFPDNSVGEVIAKFDMEDSYDHVFEARDLLRSVFKQVVTFTYMHSLKDVHDLCYVIGEALSKRFGMDYTHIKGLHLVDINNNTRSIRFSV